MDIKINGFDYKDLVSQSTGFKEDKHRIIQYPFGKYIIKVEVDNNNAFIGIVEVEINKDFLDMKQKVSPKGYHDVSGFYPE